NFAQIVLDQTGDRGVDVVFDNVGQAVMEKSMSCLAYNGRYLMMGFASDKAVADEKLIVPRRVAIGNFKLCGVLLAYLPDAMGKMLKRGMGWSLIMREIVALVLAKKVKPVIGGAGEFEDIPAIQSLATRQTVGP